MGFGGVGVAYVGYLCVERGILDLKCVVISSVCEGVCGYVWAYEVWSGVCVIFSLL